MNLNELSDLQRFMDGTVEERFQIETNLLPERVLAFLGELSELVNDWKRAKFWSQHREPKESLLEEYVDGLHFMLSIGNKLNVNYNEIDVPNTFDGVVEEPYSKVRTKLLQMYVYAGNIALGMPSAYMPVLIERYLSLGVSLGFATEQMEAAYRKKNKINIERQAQGY